MIVVFYDGQCGLCSREINYYKKIAPQGIFDWQDVARSDKAIKKEGIKQSTALKIIHAKDRNGEMQTGIDAFILIWKQLKYWHILAFLIALPMIKNIAEFSYHCFANWRFKRLRHCQIALEKERE